MSLLSKKETAMLDNTFYKLKNNRKLTIGYFGGSITEADNNGNSYRNLVTKWFRDSYPNIEITEINAAIGGTGSGLGIYRCDRDLLAHSPDLVFVEFCVNDSYGSYYSVLATMETIFRKIRRHDPMTDIVCVITTEKSVTDKIDIGIEFESRSASVAASHHYGIPSIDVGSVLYAEVLKNGGDYLRFTADNVHPNDDGHKIYADCIIRRLSEWADGSASPAAHDLPSPLSSVTYDNASMTACRKMDGYSSDGFTQIDKSLCGRFDGYIESQNPGDSLSFEFVGENLGFYYMMAEDSGDMLISVDGGEKIRFRTWDHYCMDFRRAQGGTVIGGLEYGRHTVNIRVSDEKADESTGNSIRIGAVLYS